MLAAAGAILATSSYSRAWTETKSEVALQLAEAGVNEELRYVSSRIRQYRFPLSHSPTVLPGEPFPGQPGSVAGVAGKYWVYATDPGTTRPWSGQGAAEVTCVSMVWGDGLGQAVPEGARTVKRTVVIKAIPQSIFGMFALFALDASNDNNQPALGLGGSAVVEVRGDVGTNGLVQKGTGKISYLHAYNYRSGFAGFPGGSSGFTDEPVYERPEPYVLPTVTEVLQTVVPANGKADPWRWLAQHNDNDAILQYASVGGSLTQRGTLRAGFKKSQTKLTNRRSNLSSSANLLTGTNKTGSIDLGSWHEVNLRPGSTRVRTLILPPGDYFFEELKLIYDADTQIVIDNGGLTTATGRNSKRAPVRIWMQGAAQQDYVRLPVILTAPNDPSTFRIFFGKDGSVLSLERDSNFPAGDFQIAGAVYAITNRLDPVTLLPVNGALKGTEVDIYGSTSRPGDTTSLLGSVIADRIQLHGHCRVLHSGQPFGAGLDPASGLAFDPDCDEDPCYSDGGQ